MKVEVKEAFSASTEFQNPQIPINALKSSGSKTIFGISNAVARLEKWKRWHVVRITKKRRGHQRFRVSLFFSKTEVSMALSETEERERTKFSNRLQPISGKMGASIIGPTDPS